MTGIDLCCCGDNKVISTCPWLNQYSTVIALLYVHIFIYLASMNRSCCRVCVCVLFGVLGCLFWKGVKACILRVFHLATPRSFWWTKKVRFTMMETILSFVTVVALSFCKIFRHNQFGGTRAEWHKTPTWSEIVDHRGVWYYRNTLRKYPIVWLDPSRVAWNGYLKWNRRSPVGMVLLWYSA